MSVYSHSRISTYEQCALKFKYQYIDKIIPLRKETIEAYLGRIVHETLEWLYTQIKNKKTPLIEEVIDYYSKKWEEKYESDTPIIDKRKTQKDYFNKGIKFLIDYYMKYKPFNTNTIEVEKRIVINLDENGKYKIQGFIDRLDYNSEIGEYEIHDYKTTNSVPYKERIDNDRQLALYSIGIKELYGKNVTLVWHFLAHNLKVCSRRTEEQLQELKGKTLSIIKKIESTEEFLPNKSVLCSWCEYKPICPVWGNQPPKTDTQRKLTEKEVREKELDIWD